MILPQHKAHTYSVYNASAEEVPPFAVMALDVDNTCQEEFNGLVSWRIKKPDADAERRQDPSMLLINRAVPIPAGQYGIGLQNWPCRVLLESDGYTDGVPVGPKADQWSASDKGEAFRLLVNDQVDDRANDFYNLGWIARAIEDVILGELDEDLNSSSNATTSVLRGDPLADSGINVEVYDPAFIPVGEKLEEDCRVWARWYAGKYYLVSASCCPVAQ
jgi:hypothetical protein